MTDEEFEKDKVSAAAYCALLNIAPIPDAELRIALEKVDAQIAAGDRKCPVRKEHKSLSAFLMEPKNR